MNPPFLRRGGPAHRKDLLYGSDQDPRIHHRSARRPDGDRLCGPGGHALLRRGPPANRSGSHKFSPAPALLPSETGAFSVRRGLSRGKKASKCVGGGQTKSARRSGRIAGSRSIFSGRPSAPRRPPGAPGARRAGPADGAGWRGPGSIRRQSYRRSLRRTKGRSTGRTRALRPG